MASYRQFRRNLCSNTVVLLLVGIAVIYVLGKVIGSLARGKRSLVFDDDDDDREPTYDFTSYADYAKALKETASPEDNTVLMALVDSGYLETAYNFFESSIVKHKIDNFLFVALDHSACDALHRNFLKYNLHCFVYKEEATAIHASIYESREFREKIYLRRFLILEAIRLNYNVLLTDLDIVFLRDPRQDVKQTCSKKKCDMAAEWDEHLEKYNAGFIYVRATNASIKFYKRLARYELSHGVGQMALNAALREFEGSKGAAKMVPLAHHKYGVGIVVFPRNTCPEAKVLKDSLIIHNNYIIEQHNKIFRLKECMLWDWDGPDGYFSNPTRRYLTIETAGQPGYAEHQGILNAFAIAKILHRTVILPKFICNKARQTCNLLQRMYDHSHLHFMKRLQNATRGNFRESSFLDNPRVPPVVKRSLSPFFHIAFKDDPIPDQDKVTLLTPSDTKTGPTLKEVVTWFSDNRDLVLRFDNLKGHFVYLSHNAILGENFVRIIRQL